MVLLWKHHHQYIKILRVCPSVRLSEAEMGVFFSLKLFVLGLQRAARYVRHATVGACRRTSNRQENKIIQRAGPEQDTIFHLHVTACRRQGSHRQDERLAWVASRGRGLRAPAHSSRKSWEQTTREQTTFFLWLINSPCALTGSNL